MSNPEEVQVRKERTIEIEVQSTRGKKQLSFPKPATVAEVIDKAIDTFDFQRGDRFELVLATKPGDPLQETETLISYQVVDGDVLILTAIGGGV